MSSEEKRASCDFVHSIFSDLENYPKHFSIAVSRPGLLISVPLRFLSPYKYETLPKGSISSSTPRLTASAMMAKILVSPIKERFILEETCEVVSKGNNQP